MKTNATVSSRLAKQTAGPISRTKTLFAGLGALGLWAAGLGLYARRRSTSQDDTQVCRQTQTEQPATLAKIALLADSTLDGLPDGQVSVAGVDPAGL